MKFLSNLFKKNKKVKCPSCRDFGVYKKSVVIANIFQYCDGIKVISYVEPLEGRYEYNPCNAQCDAWRENNLMQNESIVIENTE